MKLSEKPLVIQATVGGAINAFRKFGKEADAAEMESNMHMVEEFTNWTWAELMSLEMTELPEFMRTFTRDMKAFEAAAIPPPTAPPSKSGEVAPDAPSPAGSTL